MNSQTSTLHARGRPRAIARLVGCAALVASSILFAQDFVPSPGADPVRDYLEAIAQAETSGGAYASELVDLYFGMGQSLIDQGELDSARDALHRAALVMRINSGPNSLEQTNYLYGIAEVEFRLGDREAAVEALEHIYRIHAQQYGEDNPDMLPLLEQISGWYTGHLADEGVRARPSDYENLSYLAGRIAHLIELQRGLGHPETAMSLRALAQAHYRAIHLVALTGVSPAPELVMNYEDAGNTLGPDRSIVGHFLAGENALLRAVQSWQANPDATELEVAEAIAQVGDWNLAFHYYRSAEHNYEKAYRTLADSPEHGSLADQYLGTPTPIRFMNTTESYVRDLRPLTTGDALEISMKVTTDGRLHDIGIADGSEKLSEEQAREIKDMLENTLFRPAIVDGAVQTVDHYVWKVPPRDSVPAPEANLGVPSR